MSNKIESVVTSSAEISAEEVSALAKAIYCGKFEEATMSLIDVLHRVSKEGLHESSLEEGEKIMSVLSSAVTALFSSPNFFLNETGFRSLIALKMPLRRVFLGSSFKNMDHIFANLSEISDGKAHIKPENYAKLMLVLSLDTIQESMFPIIENMQEDAQLLIWISLLDTRYVITEFEQKNLDRLIAMADKIRISPFKADLEILCAARVWFFCSYWDNPRKHQVKRIINQALFLKIRTDGLVPIPRGDLVAKKEEKPTLLIIFEKYTKTHVMYRCFAKPLKKLSKFFRVYAMGPRDSLDAEAVDWVEEVFFFSEENSVANDIAQIVDIRPDLIFYPSLGMYFKTIILAQLRFAPIQLMGGGHPASSCGAEIDYYIAEENFATSVADGISERVVLTQTKTMASFERPSQEVIGRPRDRNEDHSTEVRIVCNSMYQKITPAFIEACHQIEIRANTPVTFYFLTGCDGLSARSVQPALDEKIKSVVFFKKLPYSEYSEIIAMCDIQLTPFPFGNTNGFIDAMVLGLPTVVLDGDALQSRSESALSKIMELPDFCLAKSREDYVAAVVRLIESPQERIEISNNILSKNLDEILFFPLIESEYDFPNRVKYLFENHKDMIESAQRIWLPGQ